jgi:hypothetical protein
VLTAEDQKQECARGVEPRNFSHHGSYTFPA